MDTQVRKTYKSDFAGYMLCLALDVGEGMLRAGGEISRVENTIERICRSYGAAHVEVFTIISVIHAAIRMPDGSYSSQMRRVRSTGTDLYRLELFNSISRQICAQRPSLDEVEEKIKAVKAKKAYPTWLRPIAFGAAAGGFALFFGGSARDVVCAAVIGVILWLIDMLNVHIVNTMAKTLVSAFVAGVLSFTAVMLGVGEDSGIILIGTIMLLVPGLSFGTALRDLLCGDLLAGMLKSVQAVLSALMIAFGYILAMLAMGGGVL